MSLKSYCEENNRTRILLEWDAEKNLPLTPETVAPSSGTPVWWKCERGHSWCTQVRSRSKSSTGCPKCREEKLAAKRQRRIEEARKRFYEKSEQRTAVEDGGSPLSRGAAGRSAPVQDKKLPGKGT